MGRSAAAGGPFVGQADLVSGGVEGDRGHVGPHEHEAAAAGHFEVFVERGIGDGTGVETGALIADPDGEGGLVGLPIDADMQYAGSFFTLLNPYALLAGLATLSVFTLHGAIFLCLKTGGEVREKACQATNRLWIISVIVLLALLVYTYFVTDFVARLGVNPGILPLTGMIAILLTGYLGGAIATHVRLHELFIVQAALGVVIWLGVWLREPRLRELIPLRS